MAPAKLSHIIKNFALLNKYQFRTGAPATFVRVKIKIVAAKKIQSLGQQRKEYLTVFVGFQHILNLFNLFLQICIVIASPSLTE
jgi:hypothetical protein